MATPDAFLRDILKAQVTGDKHAEQMLWEAYDHRFGLKAASPKPASRTMREVGDLVKGADGSFQVQSKKR